jgi:hypothetical protein
LVNKKCGGDYEYDYESLPYRQRLIPVNAQRWTSPLGILSKECTWIEKRLEKIRASFWFKKKRENLTFAWGFVGGVQTLNSPKSRGRIL